jgi:hypothetical protein
MVNGNVYITMHIMFAVCNIDGITQIKYSALAGRFSYAVFTALLYIYFLICSTRAKLAYFRRFYVLVVYLHIQTLKRFKQHFTTLYRKQHTRI